MKLVLFLVAYFVSGTVAFKIGVNEVRYRIAKHRLEKASYIPEDNSEIIAKTEHDVLKVAYVEGTKRYTVWKLLLYGIAMIAIWPIYVPRIMWLAIKYPQEYDDAITHMND